MKTINSPHSQFGCCGFIVCTSNDAFEHALVTFILGHIHNQGTQKDGLTKKIANDYFGFYYIYYFMIIVDWYMTIIRMMSCNTKIHE
jgi:hypothetical protein